MFDSLPYYDRELDEDPALKQKVERALAKELGTIPTELHPDVPPPIELFKVRARTACLVL
jgi:pre-mRNA-splicing factor SPF27